MEFRIKAYQKRMFESTYYNFLLENNIKMAGMVMKTETDSLLGICEITIADERMKLLTSKQLMELQSLEG